MPLFNAPEKLGTYSQPPGCRAIMQESTMSNSREVHLLSATHADGLRALSMEPDVAAVAAISVAPSPGETAEYITVATNAREEGRAYIFVLTDRTELLGICRLIGVLGVPRLIVAISHAYRGQGNGSFLVRHVLEFAFETLQLERVTATGACLRLVSQFGQLDGNGLTRQEWQTARAKARTV
jgi:RimJ/RimL family protein N-acetyltransferase